MSVSSGRQFGKALGILWAADRFEYEMHCDVDAWGAPGECHGVVSRGEAGRLRQARRHARAVAGMPVRVLLAKSRRLVGSHPLTRCARFTRSDSEALTHAACGGRLVRPLSRDDCRSLAAAPAGWLEVAALERDAVGGASAGVSLWLDRSAAAAWLAHRRRMHASAVASARAARLAAGRLGLAVLPG